MVKIVQEVGAARKRIREAAEGGEKSAVTVSDDTATSVPKSKKTRTALTLEGVTTSAVANKKGKAKAGAASKSKDESDFHNVIYLGHLPKGFFETEMRKFFSQFGKVRRVKLYRSKRTGNSKGYAFVQFESMDVAEVVAEAMDGYFLSDHQLVSHVVPNEKCHIGMFLPYKKKLEVVSTTSNSGINEEDSREDIERKYNKTLRSDKRKIKKLKDKGIDFDL